MMSNTTILTFFILLSFTLTSNSQSITVDGFEDFIDNELDLYITTEMKKWSIPGLAIAVVKENTLVYNKGFGLQSVDDTIKVTPETPFRIGSLTKAITCASLLLAEERGELDIHKPIATYLHFPKRKCNSEFLMLDTEDLMCGRSGLPSYQGDFLFWKTTKERSEVLDVICSLEHNPIRKRFTYSNLSYLLLGEILEHTSNKSWEENLRSNFFKPLGMNNSYPSRTYLNNLSLVAAPHLIHNKDLIVLPSEDIENMGPAGSIFSTSSDMSKWILEFLSLDNDSIPSKFPKSVLKKIRKPYTLKGYRRKKDHEDQLRFLFSGMGWSISDEFGNLTYTHDGGTDGFKSELMIIPEKNFGVIILTNSRTHDFAYALAKRIQRELYNKKNESFDEELFKDFNNDLLDQEKEEFRYSTLRKKPMNKKLLNQMVGHYSNDLYGPIEIAVNEKKAVLKLLSHQNQVLGELIPLENHMFIIDFDTIEMGVLELEFITKKQTITSFKIYPEGYGKFSYTFLKH